MSEMGSRKVRIVSERGQEKLGLRARGVKKSKDYERERSRKVRIMSERGQEK
jgi:prophage antirepressor-like protein